MAPRPAPRVPVAILSRFAQRCGHDRQVIGNCSWDLSAPIGRSMLKRGTDLIPVVWLAVRARVRGAGPCRRAVGRRRCAGARCLDCERRGAVSGRTPRRGRFCLPETEISSNLMAVNSSSRLFAEPWAVVAVPSGPGQPVDIAPPAITGTDRQGQKLIASTGTWSPAVTSYVYT